MKPELSSDSFKISPEMQVAVFARKGNGHTASRHIETDDGTTWVYLTDPSFGKSYRAVLEIRETIDGDRIVYMTVYTDIFVSRSTAVLDEIFECNSAVKSDREYLPVISISDGRDELLVEQTVPLCDSVASALRASEIDCIGLCVALEGHFDELYCTDPHKPSRVKIEAVECCF